MTLQHRLRAAAGNSGGGAGPTPAFHYDFGAGQGTWDGSSVTVTDLSGNGNHTAFNHTNHLVQTTVVGASCLEASSNYCDMRGNYYHPSGVGNSVGTGDYALQFVWCPYLRPHGANSYYSTAPMRMNGTSNGSYGPSFYWTEGGLLLINGVSGNAYTPAFPTAHNAAGNAAPAHTVNAPYPSTPASYTSGSPHRNSSPYMGYGQGWEHVIITRRSGTLYCYLDGVQTASYTNTDSYTTWGGGQVLGTPMGTWANYMPYCAYNSMYLGGLAIHKFWDVGLTGAEVTAIFDSEKARFGL